jgi:PIN domain nuclease of toxin-antitoxin system
LDTCAVIWLVNKDPVAAAAITAIFAAGANQGIFVSPVSAWEIGLLSSNRSERRKTVQFMPDPKTWFTRLMARPGVRPAPLTPDIAIDASHLPGNLHGDPADRLIVATARHLGVPVVTRDRRIIAYARAGHVQVIRC